MKATVEMATLRLDDASLGSWSIIFTSALTHKHAHTHATLNTKRLPTLLSLRKSGITERHRIKTFLPSNTHANQRQKLF